MHIQPRHHLLYAKQQGFWLHLHLDSWRTLEELHLKGWKVKKNLYDNFHSEPCPVISKYQKDCKQKSSGSILAMLKKTCMAFNGLWVSLVQFNYDNILKANQQ